MVKRKPDTVEKIEERTVFVSSDGTPHNTMDDACDYQEDYDFLQWCKKTLHDPDQKIARMILANFRVIPR